MPTPQSLSNAARRRDDIVALIRVSVTQRGYPPTLIELAKSCGVSHRMVAKDLERLVRDGRVTRQPGIPRSLRVVSTE